VEINCVEREYEHGFWPPCLYTSNLSIGVRDWKQLETVALGGEESNGVDAHLYVWEHERTRKNVLRFTERTGQTFTLEWSCLADVYWNVEYSSDLSLRLKTRIGFEGVHVSWIKADGQGVAAAKSMVGRYLDMSCLRGPEIRGPHHILFRPQAESSA
jgi:hypothetical protein